MIAIMCMVRLIFSCTCSHAPDSIIVDNNVSCDTDRYCTRSILSEHRQFLLQLYMTLSILYSSVPQDGITALIDAVWAGHTETVSVLVEAGNGADVNLQENVSKPN